LKLQKIRNGLGSVSNFVMYGAVIPLFLMVFVVSFDIIFRKSQFQGIHGSNELTMFFMVWVCMLGIPALHFKDGHVWVNLFVDKFPYRFRCFWRCAVMAAETWLLALMAYAGYRLIMFNIDFSRTTTILRMPGWFFAMPVFVAFALYFLLSLVDTIQFCADGVRGGEKKAEDGGWTDDQVKGI